MKITKIPNGYINEGVEYTIKDQAEILNDIQAHVSTDKGIILLDTSVSVDDIFFENIHSLLNYLYL